MREGGVESVEVLVERRVRRRLGFMADLERRHVEAQVLLRERGRPGQADRRILVDRQLIRARGGKERLNGRQRFGRDWHLVGGGLGGNCRGRDALKQFLDAADQQLRLERLREHAVAAGPTGPAPRRPARRRR